MLSTLNLEAVKIPEIIENLTVILFSPVIVPIAEAVKQPIVQSAVKEGIALSEICRQTITLIENLAADANASLMQESTENFQSTTTPTYLMNGKSEVARDLINVISDLNMDVGSMSSGVVDLRLLLPLGLGTLAIYQLINQGLKIEEIPWYVLAWCAFDTFIKLNNFSESELEFSNSSKN
jgi:hypothetical protein